jgi:hypothetical protein
MDNLNQKLNQLNLKQIINRRRPNLQRKIKLQKSRRVQGSIYTKNGVATKLDTIDIPEPTSASEVEDVTTAESRLAARFYTMDIEDSSTNDAMLASEAEDGTTAESRLASRLNMMDIETPRRQRRSRLQQGGSGGAAHAGGGVGYNLLTPLAVFDTGLLQLDTPTMNAWKHVSDPFLRCLRTINSPTMSRDVKIQTLKGDTTDRWFTRFAASIHAECPFSRVLGDQTALSGEVVSAVEYILRIDTLLYGQRRPAARALISCAAFLLRLSGNDQPLTQEQLHIAIFTDVYGIHVQIVAKHGEEFEALIKQEIALLDTYGVEPYEPSITHDGRRL